MNRTIPSDPKAAVYRAFPLTRDAGPEELASVAAQDLAVEPELLGDWFARLLEGRGAHRGVLPVPDGSLRHVTALLLGDGDARRYLLLTLRDPRDPALIEAGAEGERRDAAARAAASLSHTVNNSLTAILGNTDYIAEIAGLPEAAREATSLVLAAAERLERLMRRISRLSRAVRPPEGVCEPGATLRGLVERRRPGLPPGIRLDLAQGPELGTLLTDPLLVEAVVGEAVTNSATALGDAGRIRITATLAPCEAWPGFRWLAVAVRDDGPGFPQAWLSGEGRDLFSRPPQFGGSGHPLGLGILRGFADAMDGSLVISNPSGGGSRVVLQLPVLAGAAS